MAIESERNMEGGIPPPEDGDELEKLIAKLPDVLRSGDNKSAGALLAEVSELLWDRCRKTLEPLLEEYRKEIGEIGDEGLKNQILDGAFWDSQGVRWAVRVFNPTASEYGVGSIYKSWIRITLLPEELDKLPDGSIRRTLHA